MSQPEEEEAKNDIIFWEIWLGEYSQEYDPHREESSS